MNRQRCTACGGLLPKTGDCKRCARIERDGKIIAGQADFGALHVRQYKTYFTVEVAGYACTSVEILCVSTTAEYSLAYFEKWKGHFGRNIKHQTSNRRYG